MARKRKKGITGGNKRFNVTKRDLMRYITEKDSCLERDIFTRFGAIDGRQKNKIEKLLNSLKHEGKILWKNGKVFAHNIVKETAGETISGTIDLVSPRFGYLVSDELENDIKIDSTQLAGALNGDEVVAQVYLRKQKGDIRMSAKVIEISKRGREEFVGTVDKHKGNCFVIPDHRRMFLDIFIRNDKATEVKNNDKVIVKITKWPEGDRKPEGEIIHVLGQAGENTAEMHSIMAEYGLPFEFPKKVIAEASVIDGEITEQDVKERRDMRNITTFTIDPLDAKDFDDALSIQRLSNGNLEIGVHIADVTHYVKENSAIEKEAKERATSVYLVDRTIPMLPEKLSNGLCSLRPNEEKRTFSAVFEMTDSGVIQNAWYGKTLIESDRRFTYEEAQERLESGEGDFAEDIDKLNELAKVIRKKRFKKGAIGFETLEVRFRLDEEGTPLEVVPKVRKDAHKLIEEFMLLANRKVAEYVYSLKKDDPRLTMVYRTHGFPDEEKLGSLQLFAMRFGHKLHLDPKGIANSLNQLSEDVDGRPEQNVIQNLAIRSMAKAIYTTEEEMHFGLAFKHYTHFTSPIRRYPDMMVHRLLFKYLEDPKTEDKEEFEKLCKHSSEMEKVAADAERASIKYKQVEYIESMKETDFDGIVSGFSEYGIYVEMTASRCEGMVRYGDIEGDYFKADLKRFCAVGQNTGKEILLGEEVKVRVTKTDLNRRTIDLVFVQEE